jgi:hypothetical protein
VGLRSGALPTHHSDFYHICFKYFFPQEDNIPLEQNILQWPISEAKMGFISKLLKLSWQYFWYYTEGVTYWTTTSPLRSYWNIGPQQLYNCWGFYSGYIFYTDRVASPVLQPPTWVSTQFSRLLRHAWATVGLFYSLVTTQGTICMNFWKVKFKNCCT